MFYGLCGNTMLDEDCLVMANKDGVFSLHHLKAYISTGILARVNFLERNDSRTLVIVAPLSE